MRIRFAAFFSGLLIATGLLVGILWKFSSPGLVRSSSLDDQDDEQGLENAGSDVGRDRSDFTQGRLTGVAGGGALEGEVSGKDRSETSLWLESALQKEHPGEFIVADEIDYQEIPTVGTNQAPAQLEATAPIPMADEIAIFRARAQLNAAPEEIETLQRELAVATDPTVRAKLESRMSELDMLILTAKSVLVAKLGDESQ